LKITTVRRTRKGKLLFLALACVVELAAHAADTDKEKQQKQIRSMAQDTLQRLYDIKESQRRKQQSNTRSAMQSLVIWE